MFITFIIQNLKGKFLLEKSIVEPFEHNTHANNESISYCFKIFL